MTPERLALSSEADGARHVFERLATLAVGPNDAVAQFHIGIRAVPDLADHGFQDLVILPGAFYVEMALYLERELVGRVPRIARNVRFDNPIVLTAADTVVRVEVRPRGDRCVEYAFYEAGSEDASAGFPRRRPAATLEIERQASISASVAADGFSIEAFAARARETFDAPRFYAALRANGNQYGERFQKIACLWRAGDQSLGKLHAAGPQDAAERYLLHPSLLDSMTQVLACFTLDHGKTFVLQSIDTIEFAELAVPDTLWACATRAASDGGESVRGDVRVFDAAGKPHLELRGVALRLLERSVAGEASATRLVVAANFTAEPLEDSLNFWGDHLGAPLRLEFAPYNQVFQQLLAPGSALRRNRDGANVILLGLEEWLREERPALGRLDSERAERCFAGRARRVLPNGLEIAHLNAHETDYVYKEIFEDQCYLRHGIELHDGDTVFDIGANIGLFSLFVLSRCSNPTLYAFEPAPVLHEILKANCEAYGSANVHALNLGVSDRPKSAAFTFYETSSVFSGFHSDESEDRAAIQNVVRNMLKRQAPAGDSIEEYVDQLTADRLARKTYDCRLTSVSDIIREQRVERIDLLKIDAEKSELDILRGIAERDWPKIRQIVVEIHDPTREAIRRVEALLREKGFRCAVEQETLLEHAGLFNLYAIREAAAATRAPRPAGARASCLQRNVRDFCDALRSLASEASVPLVLCVCPRTPAAAADPELDAALEAAERALLAEASAIANVDAIGSASVLRRYPLKDYYDPHAHHAGHIPYTPQCYAAIGSAVVRSLFNRKSSPFKVIVLDCDNTLWQGVCGEDGAAGVELTPPYRALQEFMVEQVKAGMLLCLCSKNSEQDVLEVFERRSDMPLKREHLVAWRINWRSKSENIKSLAHELDLGLESFVFIDDNPVDCADVSANCPAVLTLQLPRDGESLAAFLEHVWAFDRRAATREDRSRTRMYREDLRRREHRAQSLSLKEFVQGLELRVELAEAEPGELERISQLTLRTNQFNLTTIRRSADEIRVTLERGARCLTARVADRFGDYGLVGVVLYESRADRYDVDSLLLSCRVLGRGVEHALVSQLGRRALDEGKRFVRFSYRPSERNSPALEFITAIGNRYRDAAGSSWTFPAETLARVAYQPQERPSAPDEAQPAPRAQSSFGADDLPVRLRRIAEELHDIGRLAQAIEEHRLGKEPLPVATPCPPAGMLETALVNIWKKVLGRPRLGVDDNFFDAGGNSLKAVLVIAAIKRELNQALTIVSLFECPTVRLLAARLGGPPPGETAPGAPSAALRGQRRRARLTRQHA
jgi:FkbH-like protein/FkbM family methyltransferase